MHHGDRALHGAFKSTQLGNARIFLQIDKTWESRRGQDAENDNDDDQFDERETGLLFHDLLLMETAT